MGIGTSSSSSGASAPRAHAYAVNRDASELGRSPAQKAPASAQPGPMHGIYMSVPRRAAARPAADSRVRALEENRHTGPRAGIIADRPRSRGEFARDARIDLTPG